MTSAIPQLARGSGIGLGRASTDLIDIYAGKVPSMGGVAAKISGFSASAVIAETEQGVGRIDCRALRDYG